MISLVSISLAYLLSVFIGSRSTRIGAGRLATIAVITLVQILVVMIAMYAMDAPVFKRFGE